MRRQVRMALGMVLAVAALAVRPDPAAALTSAAEPENSIYLQQMMARRISLNLKTSTLRQAFSTLADTAHISIDVQRQVYQLLPLGNHTRISIDFKNVSVRAAMDTIAGELALRVRRVGGRLVVVPSKALRRTGRRATWTELNLLRGLHGATVTHIDNHWPADLPAQLHQPMPAPRLPIVAKAVRDRALAAVRGELPESAVRALNTYARALHRIWYVRNDRLMVTRASSWVRSQLHRPVFLHAAARPLQTVLAELARATGVWFAPAPGLYQAIPVVNVNSNGASAEQALAALSGATGMTWRIVGDHVIVAPPRPLAAVGPAQRDPIVGMIRIPLASGIHLNLFLRKSQLSAAVRKRLGTQLQHDLDMLATKLSPIPTHGKRQGP